jgi:mono/diheme cytochrome c family protein
LAGGIEKIMAIRHIILLGGLLFVFSIDRAAAQAIPQYPLPPAAIPSGAAMYKQYCAACHGADGKGGGPAAASLKVPPPDLTTLAKRHGGKFPDDYVSTILLFGPGTTAHGSSDMPTWGPIFGALDKLNARVVHLRVQNLCEYLATIQQK